MTRSRRNAKIPLRGDPLFSGHFMTRLSILLAAFAISCAWPALAQDHKTFKDWEARSGLDGVGWLRARAIGPAPDSGLPSGLELVRAKLPDGPLHIVIVSNQEIDTATPVTLAIDAERIVLPPDKLYARDDPRALTIQDQAALDKIGAKLHNGQFFTVDASGTSGHIAFKVSLTGLAAAMLWLDDKENRVGKARTFAPFDRAKEVDPDEKYKFKVSVSLLADDKLPEDLRKLPRLILEKHMARGGCENFNRDMEAYANWSSYRLDPMNTLYELSCWSAAYNFGTRYYLVKGGDFQSAEPLMFASQGGRQLDRLGHHRQRRGRRENRPHHRIQQICRGGRLRLLGGLAMGRLRLSVARISHLGGLRASP